MKKLELKYGGKSYMQIIFILVKESKSTDSITGMLKTGSFVKIGGKEK